MKWNIKSKYKFKRSYQLIYFFLLGLASLLAIFRWANAFNNNILIINSEITSHISNFSLSIIIYLGIASSWLASGVKFSLVTFLGIFMIIANFICESLISYMNTPDIIDAIYGSVGVLIVFIYLYFLNKNGLIEIED